MPHFAFGQIFKCPEVPFNEIAENGLESYKISDDTWVLVLKESVRHVELSGSLGIASANASANASAKSIGLSTMTSSLVMYHEHFSHIVHYYLTFPGFEARPDWIVY